MLPRENATLFDAAFGRHRFFSRLPQGEHLHTDGCKEQSFRIRTRATVLYFGPADALGWEWARLLARPS